MKKDKPTYPEKYLNFKLEWIENEPFHKKGDTVIIERDGKYESIVLDTVSKEPMQTKWIRVGCRSCVRPGTIKKVGKYVYRWNDNAFTEGVAIDVVKRLNAFVNEVADLEKQVEKFSKDAALFNQLKETMKGNIIDNDDW